MKICTNFWNFFFSSKFFALIFDQKIELSVFLFFQCHIIGLIACLDIRSLFHWILQKFPRNAPALPMRGDFWNFPIGNFSDGGPFAFLNHKGRHYNFRLAGEDVRLHKAMVGEMHLHWPNIQKHFFRYCRKKFCASMTCTANSPKDITFFCSKNIDLRPNWEGSGENPYREHPLWRKIL